MKLSISSIFICGFSFFAAGCAVSPYSQAVYGGVGAENQSAVVSDGRLVRPRLLRLKNGHYRVLEDWQIHLNGTRFVVQKGYTCNGITASDLVKMTLGDGVDYPETWSAVFHDWLFTQPGISRQEADRLFYDIMIAFRISPVKAKLMYAEVARRSFQKEGF